MRYSQFEVPANNTRQIIDRSSSLTTTQPSRLIIQPQAAQVVFTGTATTAQAHQSVAASGLLIFTGTEAKGQALQTASAAGKLIFTGTEAKAQAAQTVSAAGKEIFIGTEAKAQAAQTASSAGKLIFTGSSSTSQLHQTAVATGGEVFGGAATGAQLQQTGSVAGQETFIGNASTAQLPQTVNAFDFIPSRTGDVATAQAAQTVAAAGSTPIVQQFPPYVGRGKYKGPKTKWTYNDPLVPSVAGTIATTSPRQQAKGAGSTIPSHFATGKVRQLRQITAVQVGYIDLEAEEVACLLWNL